jgi:RND family efflux transporter MFP subunit
MIMFVKKVKLIACLLLVLSPVALTACKSEYNATANQERPTKEVATREVKTVRVKEMPIARAVNVTGTLAAYDQATVGAKVPGRLQTISVDLGSIVHKGQVIAQIDPRDYQLRLEQAEAALQQARARLGLPAEGSDDRVDPEKTGVVRQARAVADETRLKHERTAQLVKQGLLAQAELDTVESAYKVALSRYQDAIEEVQNRLGVVAQRRSELALARQQLADTAINSPFDGVVQEKKASVGEFLAASAPIVTIVRMNPLRLRAEVPERDARNVRAGQKVRITIEGDTGTYSGNIVRLSPTITEQNRMLMVEAEVINDGHLRPGSFAHANIVTDAKNSAAAVPTSAIVTFAGIEKVITIKDGKALEKPVTTGRRIEDWAEIVSGVNIGDEVVAEPGNLQSGQPVSVISSE